MVNGLHYSYVILGSLLMILIGFSIYYYYKIEQLRKEKERKFNPFLSGMLVAFCVITLLFLMEGIGGFPEGTTKRFWWIAIFLWGLVVGFYIFVSSKKRPLNPQKLLKIAKKICYDIYKTEEYSGVADISLLKLYRSVREGARDDLRSDIAYFLLELESSYVKKYLIGLNAYNGYCVDIEEDPPIETIEQFTKKRIGLGKDEFLKEFGEESEIQKTKTT